MKDKKKRNTIIAFVFIIIIVLLAIFLTGSLINFFSVLEKEEIDAFLMVGPGFGIAINGTAIVFGRIPPGNSGQKELVIKNDYEHDVLIKIYARGEMKDFLTISENDFILKPEENKTIGFIARVPPEIPYGNYTGKVTVVTHKPYRRDDW
jgi:hypothetical protein